ncbi:glycosyltransferase [Burkholderia guangdongensis]|uniref:glycosyltransferase n=1 Tax=Burkholderia guangdongensis TaxID=1792500 RepID=UPI0015CDB41F|nr:glycosyltransferase [Burkholderia guangdongensis]
MATVIQNLVMPNLAFGVPPEMYVRAENRACIRYNDGSIRFEKGGIARFDTYFNGVTVDRYREHCEIRDLFLSLTGIGQFVIRFALHRAGFANRVLYEQQVTLSAGSPAEIDMPFWSGLDGGILYFCIEALDEGEISGGYFGTQTEPRTDVKLGIVITHFDRKRYVLPAIKRIREQLLNDAAFRGKIELVVVDNSQNIEPSEAQGVTLLPNKNLGGSGGFTRGLLHLKDDGSFTHCLFMDDDASCEVESIKRAYVLLSYAKTPKFAVAGALLREIETFRLFEKGARFDGVCHPLKSGLDMRSPEQLVYAEHRKERDPNYGAWWFFAYALEDVQYLPFPFFVRGDDIMFSLLNKFNIMTMNGICCWGEDFGLKSGPLPIYLDVRSLLMQRITHGGCSLTSTVKMLVAFFFFAVFSYNYATAKAVCKAIGDFCKGEKFWLENMDTVDIRREVGALTPSEKMSALDRATYALDESDLVIEGRFRTFVRLLSLNGFLLPRFLLKDATVFQQKGFRGTLRQVFRYKSVFYQYQPTGVGYIAHHDKTEFVRSLAEFIKVMTKFARSYGRLRAEYQAALPKLTSEKFWRDVYGTTD